MMNKNVKAWKAIYNQVYFQDKRYGDALKELIRTESPHKMNYSKPKVSPLKDTNETINYGMI